MDINQDEINAINWFHHFDRETFGFETSGGKEVRNIDEALAWGFGPHLFAGKSVLDIGAWDGYYSFYAEKSGASRVLATDHFCWSGPGCGTKAGFDLAHRIINSKVESMDIDVPDITPESVGKFDIVLFLGVLYHLPDPIRGLEVAASVANELLIVETTFEKLDDNKALFEFRPERLIHDRTNYWSPNIKGLGEVLTKLTGIRKAEIRPWEGGRIICFAYK